MLKAILEGKAGRIESENGDVISWREVFRVREDLLTAVFFSRIPYLSEEARINVLALIVGSDTATSLGGINEIKFWPKLTGLPGRNYVEPDVQISCESALLLIEVKPPLGGQQHSEQWENEIESLIRQKGKEDSEFGIPDTIHFIALGRNAKTWKADAIRLETKFIDHGVHIHALEWDHLSHGVAQLLNQEDGRDGPIYRDWLDAFALFGLIEKPKPFTDMLNMKNRIFKDWHKLYFTSSLQNRILASSNIDWMPMVNLFNKINLGVEKWGLVKKTRCNL